MIRYTAFIMIIGLRIIYHPLPVEKTPAPFASQSSFSSTTFSIPPATFISIEGHKSNNKIILNWIVGDNETADQFEVEKGTDGKQFSMAALVFGTDKSETGNYQFYEKVAKQRIFYRIKMITKNKETHYSTVVEINPNA